MKQILLTLIFTSGIILPGFAGITPGQETSRKKFSPKTTSIPGGSSELEAPATTGFEQQKINYNAASASKSDAGLHSNNLSAKASKIATHRTGQKLNGFSLKNMFQAGKFLKKHAKGSFIRISVTIFLFLLLLFLIGMFIGTLIYTQTSLLFFIGLILLLLWILLFLLGNLGIKKR